MLMLSLLPVLFAGVFNSDTHHPQHEPAFFLRSAATVVCRVEFKVVIDKTLILLSSRKFLFE